MAGERGRDISPEEFIRRRPEVSADQGPPAGPGAPETIEPVQGRETENDGGPSRARPRTSETIPPVEGQEFGHRGDPDPTSKPG